MSNNMSNQQEPKVNTNEAYQAKHILDRIENNFTYHRPKDDQPERYEALRAKAKELAIMIVGLTPQSREQSLAMTALEECVMWANAAIARNE